MRLDIPISRVAAVAVLSVFVSGCYFSYKRPDSETPEEYWKYWNREENRRDSLLYDFTDAAKMERRTGH